MSRLILLTRTLWRLGPANIARVAVYRLLLKAGWYRRVLPVRPAVVGPFLTWPAATPAADRLPAPEAADWEGDALRVVAGELPVFSDGWRPAGFPPAWHRSLLTGVTAAEPHRHWTEIPDFSLAGGDVKGYWEAARFDGLMILTLGWLASCRAELQRAIETWLADWAAANPANAGIQWKCGQETGIRLMHLLLATELLSRRAGVHPTPALGQLVEEHCERISRTMLYAIGQDNNHGTSEAAALFAGGVFLERHGTPDQRQRARRWSRSGRRWLENRIARLVMPDGSFSQHSVNYHRVMLDTCSFAETWRGWYGLQPFSQRFVERCAQSTLWLDAMCDATTGDAPNLGANDGARLFVLHRQPYRDYRPSVRWAARMFGVAVPPATDGGCDEVLQWLGLSVPVQTAGMQSLGSRLFNDGGYARLAAGDCWAMLRLPRYRFRPSQSDALHLDLWVRGENLVRDAGSFSYNTQERWLRYFSGAASHSTVQFDDRDQMPKLSRFLYACWLECETLQFDARQGVVRAGYRDHAGAIHRRCVRLEPGRCIVEDELDGFTSKAVLRWRLAPGDWTADAQGACSATTKIRVSSAGPGPVLALVEGQESRHYGRMTPLPVLEVTAHAPTTLVTELTWTL